MIWAAMILLGIVAIGLLIFAPDFLARMSKRFKTDNEDSNSSDDWVGF
ncbi:MAG: hypothetical protein KUG65_06310 [Sphingomonadaceae bacterium]|nr:hypothetical protein [Sphingomonadaceae bacterium]